jgi:hypothetical protein
MFHPYQLHSLVKLYHEEALQEEARVRNLGHRAKAHRSPCSEQQGRWFLLGKLAAVVGSS